MGHVWLGSPSSNGRGDQQARTIYYQWPGVFKSPTTRRYSRTWLSTDSVHAPVATEIDLPEEASHVDGGHLAGVYLGIWNIYANHTLSFGKFHINDCLFCPRARSKLSVRP